MRHLVVLLAVLRALSRCAEKSHARAALYQCSAIDVIKCCYIYDRSHLIVPPLTARPTMTDKVWSLWEAVQMSSVR
jgi:hypothetical protein